MVFGLVAVSGRLLVWATPSTAAKKQFTFRVTIVNLGKANLTSPVWAVHNRRAKLFRRGQPASNGVGELAKDGGTALALADIRKQRGVGATGVAPAIGPGGKIRFTIKTTRKHLRFSWISMQVCTNDGFAGQDSARLPWKKLRAIVNARARVRAWDGGVEDNVETASSVPCEGAHGVGPIKTENGVVAFHPGIQDVADVNNATQGWTGRLAKITIRRIK